MSNIYKLNLPFWALAPMAGITTYPFAKQAKRYGADLVWTPMVHTDTILNNWNVAYKTLNFKDLKPYLVQLVGNDPKKIAESIKIVQRKLNPCGIDLNFACPDKNIIKSGCGGALLQNKKLAISVVEAALSVSSIPVSVKTRLGWDSITIISFAKKLEKLGVSMITLHGRTVKQSFNGTADWKVIQKIKQNSKRMLVAGSGDIKDYKDAEKKLKLGLDGYLIGRASLGHPWIFSEIKNNKKIEIGLDAKKQLIIEIAKYSNKIWGEKGIVESRKHFAWYLKGFQRAADIRKKLMCANKLSDVIDTLGFNIIEINNKKSYNLERKIK